MSNKRKKHEKLVKKIVFIELDLFLQIKTAQPSLCQEYPESFKLMRQMGHSVLSLKTLKSYLNDLETSITKGRNILTEKYARMNNIIAPLKSNPLINEIVRIETRWMNEITEKYPNAFKKQSNNFKIYLSCELETYSDETLELYFKDITNAEKEGRNLVEERYAMLFQELGYRSINEVEEKEKKM